MVATGHMKVQRYVHDQRRVTDWFFLARSYLEAARCLAHEYGASEQSQADLASPLIFNLRHGLELYLKFLVLGTGETSAFDFNHNIHAPFSKVRRSLAELDDQSVAYAADGLGIERGMIRKYLEVLSWNVEKITEKYYSYGFLAIPIEDEKNELFRYPSTIDAGVAFDSSKVHERLSPAEVVEDVESLRNFLWSFFLMFAKNEAGTHVWTSWGAAENADV
jgi:hypothetical protein